MTLHDNLRRARLARGMTQSALAAQLGVSDRAVSRWETGAAAPDIALLPQLALLLETSADALLGIDPVRTRQEILLATEDSIRLLRAGSIASAVAMLREKSAAFPNQPELMAYLARALLAQGDEAALRECLSLCRAAENSGRPMRLSTTFGCKQTTALCLSRLGRKEEAVRLVADELPAIFVSRELLQARVAPAEQAEVLHRRNAGLLADLLCGALDKLGRQEAAEAVRSAVANLR